MTIDPNLVEKAAKALFATEEPYGETTVKATLSDTPRAVL